MKRLSAFVFAVLFVAGCSGKVQPDRLLDVRVNPPVLKSGLKVEVKVKPVKEVSLAWVKGLVDLPGFGKTPVVPLRYNKKLGVWSFKSMIPSFVSVPVGEYEVRAWGETEAGEKYKGKTTITVE